MSAPATRLVRVAPTADIAPGERRIVEVDGRSIGVFNLGDGFSAIANVCVHQGGPVCWGRVEPRVHAEVMPGGEVRESLSPAPDTIACPWHGWEYDVRTGTCLANPRKALRTFPVVVRDGDVYLEIAERAS
ncbi:(2Fe-2S)-binding protein [Pseudonocardia sulfidoxydans NBRC 16205]|uniref:(2Fe-2S)-binding protein n=1 Tax=Pseudonocardia sulfidoxydans NBRC 16205 TaxID=1223511 RepID=A0A511DEE2_9PSEU|nr:Rieske 2Fe-2S domain-containing protein [Pseudonocardia sulfidoxydans]GEL23146.1 (2Fe-2S)-binding protein [Pseudonocardia sulfidoxydans NBRC 16205]